jgi:hypothetical protein
LPPPPPPPPLLLPPPPPPPLLLIREPALRAEVVEVVRLLVDNDEIRDREFLEEDAPVTAEEVEVTEIADCVA